MDFGHTALAWLTVFSWWHVAKWVAEKAMNSLWLWSIRSKMTGQIMSRRHTDSNGISNSCIKRDSEMHSNILKSNFNTPILKLGFPLTLHGKMCIYCKCWRNPITSNHVCFLFAKTRQETLKAFSFVPSFSFLELPCKQKPKEIAPLCFKWLLGKESQ